MNFDEKRISILNSISDKSFNNTEMMKFLEALIIEMIEKEDNFFGNFMIQVKRKIDLELTYPVVTVPTTEGFEMYFNPSIFFNYSKSEMKALIKHEIYHIMYNHYEREKSLREKYDKVAVNIALDISINQFIKNIPMEYGRLYSINMEYNLNLKDNMPCEYYAEELHKKINDKKEPIIIQIEDKFGANIENAHDLWWKGSISKEISKALTKRTAVNSLKGNVPKEIADIILSYDEKAEISWQNLLKKLIPSLRAGHKKTITRRNRRQPERMDLKGELTNSIPDIVVAIDISASMSDEDINKIMIEILEISKLRGNEVTIIECDNEVRRVYKISSIKDLKKRKNSNGSTLFAPVFQYIKEKNMRNSVLIYFTDGVGEKELEVRPVNKNTIWVLTSTEDLSLKRSFGIIKKMDNTVVKGEGGASALQRIKDSIHDWAR